MQIKHVYAISIAIAGSALSILFGILGARLLGPVEYGLYAFTISLASIISALIQFGLSSYSTSYLGANEQDLSNARIKKIVAVWLSAPLCAAALLTIAALSFKHVLPDLSIDAYLFFLMAGLMAQSSIITGVLRGLNYRLLANIPEPLLKPLAMILGLLVLLYLYELSAQNVTFITVLGNFISITTSIYLISKYFSRNKEVKNFQNFGINFGAIFQLWLISLISVASDHASVILVQLVGTSYDVAFFKLAVQCGSFVSMIILTISSLYMAEVSRKFLLKEYADIRIKERMVVANSIFLALPVIMTLAVYSYEITVLLFGHKYAEASSGILLYCVFRFILMFTGVPGQILMMTHRAKVVFKSWSLTTALALLIGSLTFKEFGYKSFLVAMFIGDFLNNIFLRTRLKLT
jgi:O-antigen/teichoic acid export membrane protein